MSLSFEAPRDPVELSRLRAQQLTGDMFDHTHADEKVLAELDYAAQEYGMHGERYFIEANRAYVVPVAWDNASKVAFTRFDGLTLEGQFATFSRLSIGRLIGSPNTVRALCITLGSAMLLPFFDSVPDDSLLHIPVLAVEHIAKAA